MEPNHTHTKHQLLAALKAEFDRWESLLGSLSEPQLLARDLPAGLSIKDVVAHLMAWQGLSIARLEAARDNRDPDYELGPAGLDPDADENVERINAWIHETYLEMPWPQVYERWRAGFLRFIDLADAMPEDALLQPARYWWLKDTPLSAVLEGSYDHHHDEHYAPLVHWLKDNGQLPHSFG